MAISLSFDLPGQGYHNQNAIFKQHLYPPQFPSFENKNPQPTFPQKHFSPVPVGSYNAKPRGGHNGNQYKVYNEQHIINQSIQDAQKGMNYTPLPTAEDIKNKPIIPPPNTLSKHQQTIQGLLQTLRETYYYERGKQAAYYNQPDFAAVTKGYHNAREYLKQMLSGSKSLSLKDAFYKVESTYGKVHLSYQEYDNIIDKSVAFIRQWLKENRYDLNNNEALHYGIQSFMRDTLYIASKSDMGNVGKTMHLPFFYDYIDFVAEKDFRNYFVTKTLATGTGQCNTLPATYLLLAEGLGAKTYLTLAPNHSFIKYPDNYGRIHNYEPTSHWSISDQWYSEHLFVRSEAERNRIYLDTLNTRQIVASCMLDLAFGYIRKHGVADGKFVTECVDYAMNYFPNKEANIQGWFLRSNVIAVNLKRLLMKHGIEMLNEMDKVEGAPELYAALYRNEEKIRELGYQDLPEHAYETMMKEHEFKGLVQQGNNVDTKSKRSLFVYLK